VQSDTARLLKVQANDVCGSKEAFDVVDGQEVWQPHNAAALRHLFRDEAWGR
tara:strand:+ start:839 stop:994 length:156 start_codon:yes stop_codon:yes gene_type:complete